MNFVDKSLLFREQFHRLLLGWFYPRKLTSEKIRAEINAELKDHWKPHSIEVYELILENWEPKPSDPAAAVAAKAKEFIVFIDPDFDVDWISNIETSSEAGKCISRAESIGAKRCKHLPPEQVLEFKRLIGQAIVNGLREEASQSCKLAEDAALFLKDRTVERSRSWTLSSAHMIALLLSLIWLCFWDAFRTEFLWAATTALSLLLAVEGGIIGAYLSVIQKAGRGQWDAAAGRRLHLLEVFTKLVAGGVLGGIAFAFSRSIHAPPSLKELTPDPNSIFIFGLAAGFFERLIPKIISQYSESEKTPKDLHI